MLVTRVLARPGPLSLCLHGSPLNRLPGNDSLSSLVVVVLGSAGAVMAETDRDLPRGCRMNDLRSSSFLCKAPIFREINVLRKMEAR